MAKEYVPFGSYGLLRRIVDQGPQRIRRDNIDMDEQATYLVSRGLAASNPSGDRISDTEVGRSVGLIEYSPDDVGSASADRERDARDPSGSSAPA